MIITKDGVTDLVFSHNKDISTGYTVAIDTLTYLPGIQGTWLLPLLQNRLIKSSSIAPSKCK